MPHTRGDLVREAHAAGYDDASERLVTEWARLGLLGQPNRIGRRDGRRGAFYQWPDSQLPLFLTLLGKRTEVPHTKGLVVVPVGVWMYWGDEWISVRQVHRALMTSTSLFGPPNSYERALANARDTVRALQGDGAPRAVRTRLREVLADGFHRGHIDPNDVRPLLEQIVDHDPQTGGWGPFGFSIDDVVTWLRAMVVAVTHIKGASHGQLVEARARQRMAVLDYARSWRNLAQMPTYGHMFEEPTVELLINRSCRDLLFNFGARLLADEEGRKLPPVPLFEWRQPPLNLIRMSPT